MTWIEVADTAIKIGLGALITGIISYITSNRSYKNQIILNRINRYQSITEQVSIDFENSISEFLIEGYELINRIAKYKRDDDETNYNLCMNRYYKMHETLDTHLNVLSGKLKLLSLTKSALLLETITADFLDLLINENEITDFELEIINIVEGVKTRKDLFYKFLFEEIQEKTK